MSKTNAINILFIILLFSQNLLAQPSGIIERVVDGDYIDISQNIRNAIIGKGINIAHELHASDMLNRTASAFGYKSNIYKSAITYEFCSAELSHLLARANPKNIVVCPFTISIYELNKHPGKIHIVYQKPLAEAGSGDTLQKITQLIENIIEDALW